MGILWERLYGGVRYLSHSFSSFILRLHLLSSSASFPAQLLQHIKCLWRAIVYSSRAHVFSFCGFTYTPGDSSSLAMKFFSTRALTACSRKTTKGGSGSRWKFHVPSTAPIPTHRAGLPHTALSHPQPQQRPDEIPADFGSPEGQEFLQPRER